MRLAIVGGIVAIIAFATVWHATEPKRFLVREVDE